MAVILKVAWAWATVAERATAQAKRVRAALEKINRIVKTPGNKKSKEISAPRITPEFGDP
jgi:hypothetical protein